MVRNFDLNYPPIGYDLFSLEAKYGIDFSQLIENYIYINQVPTQQIRNDRVVSVEDTARSDGPSAKRRLTVIKRVARSRNSGNEFEYDEVPKEASQSHEVPKAPTFNCSICLNTMAEETSTKCGHIFCGECIAAAIGVQGKCPTCRRKLKRRDTFRVYLPNIQ